MGGEELTALNQFVAEPGPRFLTAEARAVSGPRQAGSIAWRRLLDSDPKGG